MSKINVNPDRLDSISEKLKGICSDMRDNADRLSHVSSIVETAWKSQSTQIYLNEVTTVKNNLYRLSEGGNDLAAMMSKMAVEVREIEKENQQAFQRR